MRRKNRVTIEEFQQANAERCPAFGHGLSDWSLLEWAGALAGEVGELANLCKKIRRQEQGIGGAWAKRDGTAAQLRAELAGEVGDVLAYLVLLCEAAGLSLASCACRKFDEVSDAAGYDGPRLDPNP